MAAAHPEALDQRAMARPERPAPSQAAHCREGHPWGGIPASPWLGHLRRHLAASRGGRDPEAIHQVRVAEARLRVWLDLGGRTALRNELRWLRRCTAAVRDLDVALEQGPPPEWATRLRAKRAPAHSALRLALDQPRLADLLLALGTLPPVPRRQAERAVAQLARETLRRGKGVWKRADPEDLHRLRRAARRLRYALEWMGHRPGPVFELQDALGEACDRVVALQPLASGPRGAEAYRARLEGQLHGRVKRARRVWRRTKPLLRRLSESARLA